METETSLGTMKTNGDPDLLNQMKHEAFELKCK